MLRGNYLPYSKHRFRRIFGRADFLVNFYCKRCESFVKAKRSGQKMEGIFPCETCGLECKLSNMNEGYFFVTFSMKDQLKFLSENTGNVMELLDHRWTRKKSPGFVSDIYDAKVYSELTKDGNFLSHRLNLSMTFNTDGAQVFDTGSKNSLWPVFFRINEFPPSIRFDFNNCLLAGMWFAANEPNMQLFLSAFVQEVDDLYENGFIWSAPNGDILTSKVILLNCVADSKARPLVQNSKMHNGYWGCSLCDHPGVIYEGSNQAKYPMNQDNVAMLLDHSFTYTVDAANPVTKVPETFQVSDRKNNLVRRDMELQHHSSC